MRLSEELRGALTEWQKTADGYDVKTSKGLATLVKKGKALSSPWVLTLGKKVIELPRRASFDHAEGALKDMGAMIK
jgi:hypothetical protein